MAPGPLEIAMTNSETFLVMRIMFAQHTFTGLPVPPWNCFWPPQKGGEYSCASDILLLLNRTPGATAGGEHAIIGLMHHAIIAMSEREIQVRGNMVCARTASPISTYQQPARCRWKAGQCDFEQRRFPPSARKRALSASHDLATNFIETFPPVYAPLSP